MINQDLLMGILIGITLSVLFISIRHLLLRQNRYSRRKKWLSRKFQVDYENPLYILADKRKVLKKSLGGKNYGCVFVYFNWRLCNYNRQEYDCILYNSRSDYEQEHGCVFVSKDQQYYGIINQTTGKIIIPVIYPRHAIVLHQDYILIADGAPYKERTFTYKGEMKH